MVVMEQLIPEPVVFGDADIHGVWPTVKNADWCGEWEAKWPENDNRAVLNAVVGSFPDLPDCTDPFTAKAKIEKEEKGGES